MYNDRFVSLQNCLQIAFPGSASQRALLYRATGVYLSQYHSCLCQGKEHND